LGRALTLSDDCLVRMGEVLLHTRKAERVDNRCPLCYRWLQPQGAVGGLGAAKTKPYGRQPEPNRDGLATINGPTASSAGSDACGDPSGGGTALVGWSTSHGSLKQEVACHHHPLDG
jgi:hypothetical protein